MRPAPAEKTGKPPALVAPGDGYGPGTGTGDEWRTVFDQGTAATAPGRSRRWSWGITLSALLAGIGLVGALAWGVHSHRGRNRAAADAGAGEGTGLRAGAVEAARAVIGAGDWRDMIPRVRMPDVVVPMMESYYEQHTHVPMRGLAFRGHREFPYGGIWMVELDRLAHSPGDSVPETIILERIDERCLVDWEALVDFGDFQWRQFRRNLPAEATELRVLAKRATVLPGHAVHFGLREEDTLVVRLWFGDFSDPLFGVADRNSDAGQELDRLTGWRDGSQLQIAAAYRGKVGLDPVTEITGVVGEGWIRLPEPDAVATGPPAAEPDSG